MNITYILLALVMALLSIVVDWQKDKTSFLYAAKTNVVKYLAILVVGGFFAGYLLDIWWLRIILVCTGIYWFWSFFAGLFKSKAPTT